MQFLKPRVVIFYFISTVLLVYDHFPNSLLANVLPIKWVIWLFIGFILFLIIFRRGEEPSQKEKIAEAIFSLLYFIGLLTLLKLLGGHSVSGIGWSNGGLWLAGMITLWEIYTGFQKLKEK